MSQIQVVVNMLAILSMFVNAYLFYRICRLEVAVDTPSASHNSASRAISEQYNELLMAVCRKYPGESRHETALRYIRQAESNSRCGSAPKQQA